MHHTLKFAKRDAYKWVSLTVQCFALLPVDGIQSNNICFHWKSIRFFYNVFVTLVLSILLVFEVIYSFAQKLIAYRLNSLVAKMCTILLLIMHVRLAYKWASLMQHWSQIANIMDVRYGRLKRFSLRIKLCLSVFLLSNIAAYLNSVIFEYIHGNGNSLKFDFYAFIFNYIPFNSILGIILAVVYTVQFFIVNFNDFFLIVTSMYLALRFQQIHKKLETVEQQKEGGAEGTEFWREMRRDYDRLSNLCLELDDGLNGLILVSFTYNLFVIISYLFHQLLAQNQEGVQLVMFYIFFPYLVVKLLAVCVYTSWINDESLAPVNILNSVSSRNYNPEIERWLTQMSFDKVALTVGKIFKITRSIFLSVTSIVVTYELVVMQFREFSSNF